MNAFVPLLATLLILALARFPIRSRSPDDEFHGVLFLLRLLNSFYCWFWHGLEFNKPAPTPLTGPAILISNHTCNIDHMILQASCGRLLGFMIAKEYYDDPKFNYFCRLAGCIPVRRDGKDLAATCAAIRALEEGRVLPIFPEGRIVPTSGREFGEAKPGAAFIAARAAAPIIPAYIEGTPPTNQIIKSFCTPSHARITYGDPIDLSRESILGPDGRVHLEELTHRLMAEIQRLREVSKTW